MAEKTQRLRDPENSEEKILLQEIEACRNRLFGMWLFEGAWAPDFKDLARRARLSPKTVESFILGTTQRPHLNTVVRIAFAAGYRVTLVLLNAQKQRHEVESVRRAQERVLAKIRKKK